MNRVLILFLLFSKLSFSQAVNKPVEAEFKTTLDKNLVVSTDKFKDATFVKYKKSEYEPLRVYISIQSGVAYLRLVTEYSGYEWIYMDNVSVISGERKFNYVVSDTRNNVSGTPIVYERADIPVDDYLLSMLDTICNVDSEVEVRLQGTQGVKDFKLSKRVKKQIRTVLECFNKL